MGEAVKVDRTDWGHIRSLSDAEIDAAIASDPDTFFADPGQAKSASFVVLQVASGDWLWRLMADNGAVIANGQEAFSTRAQAVAAVNYLRQAIAQSGDLAA